MRTIISITICIILFSNNAFTQFTESKDNIVGTNFLIQSKILQEERKIQVYLPDSYAESTKTYPVLYVLDGHRYFLHAVSLQNSFANFRETPEFIVVGISKTASERNRNFSSNAINFLNFIEKEVIEFVDKKFRVSNRLLFGWAYGGGFVIETMAIMPNLFDAYIAASPFPLKEKINNVNILLEEESNFKKFLFFSSATNEGVVTEGTKELNQLLTLQAPKAFNWEFRDFENEEHRSTPYITMYHGIKKYFRFFPELQFSDLEEFTKAGGMTYVYDYYKQREIQFGFSSEPTKWTKFSLTRNAMRANNFSQFDAIVNEFKGLEFIGQLRVNRASSIADFFLKNKKYEEAKDIFNFLVQKFPDSPRPLNGLGNIYLELNDEKKAASYFQKAKTIE